MSKPAEHSLSDLMRRAQQGDSQAYHQLLTEITKLLKDYLGRRVSKSEMVDELAQEILMSIHTARHTFNPEKPFRPWMFAIARHKLVDYYRRCQRTVSKEVNDEYLLNNLVAPEEPNWEDGNFSESMLEAMSELTVKQRLAIELLKVKGLSIKEAASQLEMSESAVKVTAHRAYKALRQKLGTQNNADA